jgi:hypothetical protein
MEHSNSLLKRVINISDFNKLQDLDSKIKEYTEVVEEFDKNYSKLTDISKNALLGDFKKVFNITKLDWKPSNKDKYLDLIKQKKCLACNDKTIVRCHLVPQAYFKNNKVSKAQENFKNHMINIVFLCDSHHRKLDSPVLKDQLKPIDARKIVTAKKKQNIILRKLIDNELKIINKRIILLNNFGEKIDRAITPIKNKLKKEFQSSTKEKKSKKGKKKYRSMFD